MAVWAVYLSLGLLVALNASVETRPAERSGGNCKKGWSTFGDRCFRFFNNPKIWIQAEKFCLDNDGNLASVHSHEEYMFIQRLVREETHATTRAWIGGHDAVDEGHWLWSDGTKMTYEIWSPGNPSNAAWKEHCIEMNYNNGNWNDDRCYYKKPFVCASKKNQHVKNQCGRNKLL